MAIHSVILLVVLFLQAVNCREIIVTNQLQSATTFPPTSPPTPLAKDCDAIKAQGKKITGTYQINPAPSCFSTEPISVMCDMDTDCGGWVVIQRRFDGSENFKRSWSDYVNGFGTPCPNKEHWLGLEKIHRLTQAGNWKLRIDLEDFDGVQTFIEYNQFLILERSKYYQLSSLGTSFSGPGGNGFAYNSTDTNLYMYFTTMDSNHTPHGNTCNKRFSGGWWFNNCGQYSNLNGKYQKQPCSNTTQDAMRWDSWMPSVPLHRIKKSEMKIKLR